MVVEGVGVLGHCSNGDTYSEAEVKSWTVHWINSGERTFTEISPQSTCANIGNYETLVSQIESYVETYGSNLVSTGAGLCWMRRLAMALTPLR